MYYFHIKPLGGLERRTPIPPGVSSIGRLPGNQVVLDEYGVSGRHAELEVAGPEVLIRDLSSTNGLFVNGRRVESARLQPGDRVLLGSVLAVLQEAVSDRIRIRQDGSIPDGNEGGRVDGEGFPPSLLEKAYVPTASAPADVLDAPPSGGTHDPEVLLALLQEILVDGGARTSEALSRALGAVVRHLGASEGYLVGVRAPAEYYLLAAAGGSGQLVLSRGVLQQLAETGAECCIDTSERAGEGCIALPLRVRGRAGGALYFQVPVESMRAARQKVGSMRPVTAALALLVERAEAQSDLLRTRLALAAGVEWPAHAEGFRATSYDLVARSAAMREAADRLERLASEPGPVVLRGETGVGKARAARRLHALSPRRRAPFLLVGCGIAPEEEERSALFGSRDDLAGDGGRGRLDLADGGTVYFDEISELGRPSQSALAVFLRSAPRVGVVLGTRHAEGTPIPGIDPSLAEILEQLAVVPIPALRDRKDDVIALAQEFARSEGAAARKRILGLSMDACRALRDYPWPGNVLELKSVVGRAVLVARDSILDVDLFPFDIAGGRIDLPGLDALGLARERSWREAKLAFERVYFSEVLESNDGNVAKSARRAGIARKNFYYKLRQHGLVPK
ncbi:MAG TPA: sigma 54-interacting transcriptional regulator [Candidatus Polarisedimenticolaceae bacterium]